MPRTMSTARIVPDDRTSPPSEPDCEVVMAVREEPVVPNVSPTLRLVLVFCCISFCWSQFSSNRANEAGASSDISLISWQIIMDR
jgi:hypothetical protein